MTTPLQILRDARELIADEARWTRRAQARDASGSGRHPHDEAAVCWCLVGAVCKVAPASDEYRAVMNMLRRTVWGSPIDFNDAPGRTHPEVLAAMDAAIASLEREGQ